MERLAAIGLSWRHGDLARVGRLTVPEELRADACRALAARLGARELVYLATCNRIEVVFTPPDQARNVRSASPGVGARPASTSKTAARCPALAAGAAPPANTTSMRLHVAR